MEDRIFCQSCGMPMDVPDHFGTEEGGVKSKDYCCYCRKDGAFTGEFTMEEMIDFCLNCEGAPHYDDLEEARKNMMAWFPTLKRWKKDA